MKMLSSRNSVLLWVTAFGLTLAAAVPAGATVRTAAYTWTPATGPVSGYVLYTSVDGGDEELYSYVSQPNAVIEVESGASVIVSVAAFDATGVYGPRSDPSPPLRLCPGDFDGDEVIESTDVNAARGCFLQAATDDCTGADMNDDGSVSFVDFVALEVGADACAALPADCGGDMDGDGWITTSDLVALRTCIGLYAQGNCIQADLDGNGFVSNWDAILANQAIGMQACSN